MASYTGPLGSLVSHLKGRIGEAFVEALLRRANYSVTRVGREAHLPSLMKTGPTPYLPDFLAWRGESTSGSSERAQLYSILAVEVKYRRRPEFFLADEAAEVFDEAVDHWPNFRVVLVTDKPDDNGSCFQVLRRDKTGRIECLDITNAGLDVYPSTAAVFSHLLKQIFLSLNEGISDEGT